ncbi:rod shape-determining protein RodA [Escherichia coli]|uniref:Rod shape-determining protein RodA n=1 Tax=Escherichia coli TaxID=562 RepID=A0A2X1MJ34_ECOLX|nr:rod shape-determining protein RodA [Escherichia coli]
MTDNPNKKTFWDKVHLDPTMLLILLALLVYSALVIWSASGQDIGMMERKIGPNRDGSGHHGGDGANSSTRL